MLLISVLSNQAMERLSNRCAVGVPFSAFGLAVKARKDAPRKGRPQEIFQLNI